MVASHKDGYIYAYEQFPIQPGHIYLCSYSIKLTTPTTNIKMNTMGGGVQIYSQATTEWQTLYRFYRYGGTSSFGNITSIQDNRTSGWDAIKVKNIMIFDLTFMLGSSVSNYLYSLETNEAGAGYNLFKIIYPLPYYSCNERINYEDQFSL